MKLSQLQLRCCRAHISSGALTGDVVAGDVAARAHEVAHIPGAHEVECYALDDVAADRLVACAPREVERHALEGAAGGELVAARTRDDLAARAREVDCATCFKEIYIARHLRIL